MSFEGKVGEHQGLVPSPLLFMIALKPIRQEFRLGLPCELLHAGVLCLIAETEEVLIETIKFLKNSLKSKGLRVSMDKTKVMCCEVRSDQAKNSGNQPYVVCKEGVGANSMN